MTEYCFSFAVSCLANQCFQGKISHRNFTEGSWIVMTQLDWTLIMFVSPELPWEINYQWKKNKWLNLIWLLTSQDPDHDEELKTSVANELRQVQFLQCPLSTNDELCRLPLLRTHFHAVNPLLSDRNNIGCSLCSKIFLVLKCSLQAFPGHATSGEIMSR